MKETLMILKKGIFIYLVYSRRFIKSIWRNFKYRREGNMQKGDFSEIISWFQSNHYCAILGVPLVFAPNKYYTASIDRKVTKIAYDFQEKSTLIQPVCSFINYFLKTWSKCEEDSIIKEWRQFSFTQYKKTPLYRNMLQNLQERNSASKNIECLEYLKKIVAYLPIMIKSHGQILATIQNHLNKN